MADYDDKTFGPVFPTRSGEAQGGATERQMLDNLEGSKSFRTKILDDGVGTVTTLRTRNGMPHFYTETSGGSEESYPWGLCAYPLDMVSHLTWSKPCVLAWDADTQSWKTVFYNPPQTSSEVPTLPVSNESFSVTYWTDADGDTCLASGNKLFYGKTHIGNWYKTFETRSAAVSGPLLPFISDKNNWLIGQTTSKSTLYNKSNEVIFEHYTERDIGEGPVPYVQLPPAVTSDGYSMSFQSLSALNYSERTRGFPEAIPEKLYSISSVILPSLEYVSTISHLPCYGYFDGVMDAGGGRTSADDGFGKCDVLFIENLAGTGSSSGGYVFGTLWIPGHYSVITDNGETSYTQSIKDHRKNNYSLLVDNPGTLIGRVAKADGLVDVKIETAASLDQKIYAEGQYTYGTSYSPRITASEASGDQTLELKRNKVSTTNNDQIEIKAKVGDGLSLTLFKHEALSSGNALLEVRSRIGVWPQNSWAIGSSYPNIDSPRVGGAIGDGPGSDSGGAYVVIDGHKCYSAGEAAAITSAWPTFVDQFDLLGAKNDSTWHTTTSDGPYSGTANFKGAARTIVALDADLGFMAYLELTVESSLAYASTPPSWSIGLSSAQLITEHVVTAMFFVEYAGIKHNQLLFTHSLTKPGPWDRQEIENWHEWPWTNSDVGTMNTILSPRIWPDAQKFQNIENAFLHQGISQDLAGIPASEDSAIPDGQAIFAKRFTIKGIKADWILDTYGVSEGERNALDSPRYFYCPDLKPKIEDNYYQIEFDQTGLRAWVGDMKTRTTINIADKENRDAVCYRV